MIKSIVKKVSLAAVLLACSSLCACGPQVKQEDLNEPVSENLNLEKEQEEENYSVTVTDHAGRTVTIEEEPETIVSGYYISTSMLLALGEGEHLVGIENSADKRPIYGLSAPHLLELPGMGTVKEFDLEMCAVLDPDLVILPFKLEHMTESLEELDIPVLIVKPETQELLLDTIDMLGKVTNTKERAQELQGFINQNIELISEQLSETNQQDKPVVYLAGNSSFLSTAGPQMYQHTLIEYAGGENAASALTDTYWAEVSYEQVLAWDPQYIILAADASYTVEDVLADPNLAECDAVKNNHVYKIPNTIESWDSPVPGSVLGVSWLASVLHPQQYAKEQYEDTVIEFYERFYGVTPILE